jgi:peptidoglycan/xylan/chitin deacetylase (PgdA/CDA1 family)
MSGSFVISLDFESLWAIQSKLALKKYEGNLLGERRVIPCLLNIFSEYNVNSTWAIVGFLLFENKCTLSCNLPRVKPVYKTPVLPSYAFLDGEFGKDANNELLFAKDLVKMIRSFPNHEIATHTFSHCYALEMDNQQEALDEDLRAAKRMMDRLGLEMVSIVFPGNQYDDETLRICARNGLKCYRGVPNKWYWSPSRQRFHRFLQVKRGLRFIDDLFLWNRSDTQLEIREGMLNIPANRFLRPYQKEFPLMNSLRLQTIRSEMTFSARKDQIFHLWWHPHNFGDNLDENLRMLRNILDHFKRLQKTFGFTSDNMSSIMRKHMAGNR